MAADQVPWVVIEMLVKGAKAVGWYDQLVGMAAMQVETVVPDQLDDEVQAFLADVARAYADRIKARAA